jgi:hypothetical protein
MNNENQETKAEILEISPFDTRKVVDKDGDVEYVSILVPQCCRENWKSCPHGVKRPQPVKRNIGL